MLIRKYFCEILSLPWKFVQCNTKILIFVIKQGLKWDPVNFRNTGVELTDKSTFFNRN